MNRLTAWDELAVLLRPAAGGLYLPGSSRARREAFEVQQHVYGATSEEHAEELAMQSLPGLRHARAFILGIPSDTGAGGLRGANMAPLAIRHALMRADPDWQRRAAEAGVFDLGDVLVVPQLLHDELLSDAQLEASRRVLYPGLEALWADPPVSPLSIAERILTRALEVNPRAAPILIGGDHSTALPAIAALARVRAQPFGIVQPDAHSDLLPDRLGVRTCYATWAYHANELIGREQRLVQVGLRVGARPEGDGDARLGVRQFWAEACRADPAAALDAIVAHVRQSGVRGVYLSNDIDGTDPEFADATGTPEPGGLHPDFVVELIRRLGREVGLLGGDVMEVAPPLQHSPGGPERTVALAVRYLRETINAVLGTEV